MKSETKPSSPSKDPVAGKTVAEILGEIVWLMTQDAKGKEMKVSEIERLVMPAILKKSFHIKYEQVPDLQNLGTLALQPVSVEIFKGGIDASDRNARCALLAEFKLKAVQE